MSRTALVIDDSISMRRMVGFTLKEAGFEVIEAANGAEALEQLDTNTPDLIIVDINMPVMDGITFVKKARERDQSRFTPILILTSETISSRVIEGREAGATGWLVKPFRPPKLLETISKVLPTPAIAPSAT